LKSILGFEDAEISNRPNDWGSRLHPDDLPAATAAVKACMDGATDIYQVEHRMLHKNGSVRWMLSRGSAHRAANARLRRLVGTNVDITDRKIAEQAIRESEVIVRASHDEIEDLAGRLIASQEVERARISRDLHDDFSQQIAGLSIALSALKRRSQTAGAGELSGEVSALQQRTRALAENIRNMSHDLHPSALQHSGLVSTLRGHCADVERHYMVTVAFSTEGDIETAADVALCLYRVTQEALRNVVTHSGARHAEVRLARVNSHIELTIADDGGGFDIATVSQRRRGLGLVSIRERVRLAGGSVSFVTEARKGTRVRVQVPANGDSAD
jgi:PAS domain S-box-containing protein